MYIKMYINNTIELTLSKKKEFAKKNIRANIDDGKKNLMY